MAKGERMGSSDEQKTFDFTFALTAAEVELFTQITERKRRKIAPYNTYWMLILVSGLALAFAGGAIAHNYYGMALELELFGPGYGSFRRIPRWRLRVPVDTQRLVAADGGWEDRPAQGAGVLAGGAKRHRIHGQADGMARTLANRRGRHGRQRLDSFLDWRRSGYCGAASRHRAGRRAGCPNRADKEEYCTAHVHERGRCFPGAVGYREPPAFKNCHRTRCL